jgi:hypothetical protein
MNFARQSEADVASAERRKKLLSDAVTEYLDEELVDEFLIDLLAVLLTESEQYVRKATAFHSCAQLIEKGLEVLAEEQEKEMPEK